MIRYKIVGNYPIIVEKLDGSIHYLDVENGIDVGISLYRENRGKVIENYSDIDGFLECYIAKTGRATFRVMKQLFNSSGKPAPAIGHRLTETVPEYRDSFRDSGWEVVRVEEYTPEIPPPYRAGFDAICICYCAYQFLAPENVWMKKADRLAPSLASFGGDEKAYQKWLATQSEEAQA